jgi:hypothetical protein
MTSLVPTLEHAIDVLSRCSLALARAARWADLDRSGLDPRKLIAGPMKFWKWRSARKLYAEAARDLAPLRAEGRLSNANLAFSKLDLLNDLFGISELVPSRLGTLSGPSPVKQMLGAEISTYQRFETARLEVDHLLSEVGTLHARLRAA